MQNVSKNMFKDSDDSQSDIDSEDDRLEGWKPPTACGVDNSKALSSYEDIASGNVRAPPGIAYEIATALNILGRITVTMLPFITNACLPYILVARNDAHNNQVTREASTVIHILATRGFPKEKGDATEISGSRSSENTEG